MSPFLEYAVVGVAFAALLLTFVPILVYPAVVWLAARLLGSRPIDGADFRPN